ncbi:DnaJ domain-containing protein [Desulfobacula sp.]
MSFYLKIVLIIFGLLYLISPVDIIPDMLLPFVGWLDDGVVIWGIYYLIRYGRLPNFLFKKNRPFNQSNQKNRQDFASNQKKRQPHAPPHQENASSKPIPTPYEILGINPNASKNEIKAAYKEGIKRYHPDKLSHLGEEFSNLANKKFIEIQTAYDFLMKG